MNESGGVPGSRPRGRGVLRALILALVAVAPFWSLYAAHSLLGPPGTVATGFIQYDQLYYLAQARQLTEHGAWIAYKNPYDDNPVARRIYFQPQATFWSVLLRLGLDPGQAYLVLLLGGGLATALVFWNLLREMLQASERELVPLYFAGMWGGGILVLAGLGATLIEGGAIDWSHIIRYDPFEGWWFLNLGRNVLFATEAYYHALALGSILLALRRRWMACLICLAVLMASSPFTGPQFAIIFSAWGLFSSLNRWPSRPPAPFTIGSVLLLSVGLLYYAVWLPADPRHAFVYERLQLAWLLPKLTIAFAYALVAPFALHRLIVTLRSRSLATSRDVQILLAVFLVSFALANHELVTTPHQPIHFTRGYLWVSLFLLGLPSYRNLLERAFGRTGTRWPGFSGLVAVGLGVLLLSDNFVWLDYQISSARRGLYPARVEQSFMELYNAMARAAIRGVALMPAGVDYPAATYTDVIPFTGHLLQTPDFEERRVMRNRFYREGDPSVLRRRSITVLVLPRAGPARSAFSPSGWRLVCEVPAYQVFERR